MCSSFGNRTRTPYFWLRTIEHRTSNIVRPLTMKYWLGFPENIRKSSNYLETTQFFPRNRLCQRITIFPRTNSYTVWKIQNFAARFFSPKLIWRKNICMTVNSSFSHTVSYSNLPLINFADINQNIAKWNFLWLVNFKSA